MKNNNSLVSSLIKSNCQSSTTGFAAMISLVVLLMIMTTVMAVFSIVAVKGSARARLSRITLANTYAAEGFLEDSLRRLDDAGLADPQDGETLSLGDSEVTLSVSEDNRGRVYLFSAESQDRYFHKLELVTSTSTPVKVKSWRDSF